MIYNTVKKNESWYYATCIYGEQITSLECNIFKLTFKWIHCTTDAVFGYIISTIEESIKDWNNWIGKGKNAKYGVTIGIPNYKSNPYLYDVDGSRPINYLPKNDGFKQGDLFTMSFNFKRDEVSFFHNDYLLLSKSLSGIKKIYCVFCLRYMNEEIQIIKYEFIE